MGPLAGLRIIELAGIGPAPMAAMLLADLGATVLRIDRAEPADLGIKRPPKLNLVMRGRHSIALDLKKAVARNLVLELVEAADALIEGFRPGVTERLGLGPDDCFGRNARLVYGRVTGWGQDGPLSQAAGHDLNYLAITGALHAIGRPDQPPPPPLNLIGDYAGGSLYLAIGILSAMLEARSSGQGQVVDAAVVDGVAHLMTNHYGMLAAGIMNTRRGENILDGGAPFYDTYICADGRYVSVAPIEGRFFGILLARLGIDPETFPPQSNRERWPEAKVRLARTFLEKPQAEWVEILEGTDACFAPVLTAEEAPAHPHLAARRTFVDVDGVVQPAPAPRFSRSALDDPRTPIPPGGSSASEALLGWLPERRVTDLMGAGVLASP